MMISPTLEETHEPYALIGNKPMLYAYKKNNPCLMDYFSYSISDRGTYLR